MSRPALPWRSAIDILPPPAALVWIRRLPWYDKPIRAAFVAGGTFHLDIPLASQPRGNLEESIGFAHVHSWKFQFKDDEEAAFPPNGAPPSTQLTTETGEYLTDEAGARLTADP